LAPSRPEKRELRRRGVEPVGEAGALLYVLELDVASGMTLTLLSFEDIFDFLMEILSFPDSMVG
jgi:hypothetical protein